ncbi:class V lanthionine synthetase subunit LxmK [Streptomyces sp. HD]|uniref:class V lanthionine synthetase subunit LxmK n=1 Tax=Streptomyces sp. HD TaxID=3020892 RepID=UPI00232C8BA7|nr:class V lanthionine synthetase subunit LxmK [Streptomyces sp. HD]MDC0767576.1 class V lanthionine synthetase subunit LxmK [Streptomyces sp. HD]
MTTTTTERPPTRQRYRPTELETVPAVNTLLERLGLGRLDAAAVTAFGGRNDNWAGPTTTGEQVFVKTVALLPDGDCPELQRALSFEELAQRRLAPGSPLRSPGLLGADRAAGVTVHRLVPGARSGAELALDGDFDDELCRAAGRAVGALHGLGPAEDVDTGEAPLPPLAWLKALPWSAVQARSMAQIAAWQLVQDDTEVVAALHRLRDLEQTVPHAPTHCDLRFDQFIRAEEGTGDLYLCDWEEFRLADPARDVGAFAGEWLFHATYSVFAPTGEGTQRPESDTAGFGLSHQEIVTRGSASLRRHLPRIGAFWQGYLESRTPDAGLPERAAAYAGWHMFDRLIATAESHATLNPVARAAAGIGRTVLLDPAAAARTLGLTFASGAYDSLDSGDAHDSPDSGVSLGSGDPLDSDATSTARNGSSPR